MRSIMKSKVSVWKILLISPFLLYAFLYVVSVVVSLFYGAQPVLLPSFDSHKEELRREWIADKIELGSIPTLLLVVARHEIESCFYNPGEVFPEGYIDTRHGENIYFPPKKLYFAQTHYLFTLGFPRTTVVPCSNPNL